MTMTGRVLGRRSSPINAYFSSKVMIAVGGLVLVSLSWTQIYVSSLTKQLDTHDDRNLLPLPLSNLTAISTGACCGIGHRMFRNICAMVYAISNNRLVHVNWADIEWNTLFDDTTQIKQGQEQKEHYGNNYPANWNSLVNIGSRQHPINASSYDQYIQDMREIFDMPLAQSILKSLSDNLSSRVLTFLDPLRHQYASKQHGHGRVGLHLCAHIREGNNEIGDWERKSWRHINLHSTLNYTLAAMKDFVSSTQQATGNVSAAAKIMNRFNNRRVSIFVASDNEIARPWFERHIPKGWHVVKPGKSLPRPETGVWFGQHGSKTNQNLTKDQKNEAMAEAVADVFALGECDSLFIPNYSSFSVIGITLTRAQRKNVFFLGSNNGGRYLEMPEPEDFYYDYFKKQPHDYVKKQGTAAELLLPTSNLTAISTDSSKFSTTSPCTFCKILNEPALLVAGTGGKTCGSIKQNSAREVNGSAVCAIIQKEERVCCPGPGSEPALHQNAVPRTSQNTDTVQQRKKGEIQELFLLTKICTHADCRQADPPGSTWLGKHRGLGLMLRTNEETTNMQQYNLAYLFVPKAGSSTMKRTLQIAGPTQNVWLSPTTGISALDPLIFTVIRDPGKRLVSAYSTIVARYGGHFAGKTDLSLPATPNNTTDAAAPEWKKHFQESIWQIMNSVKETGWNNTNFHWNEHVVPQVEFMKGLNVSHIGCLNHINETLAKLHLKDAGENLQSNQYEHNSVMPSVKFSSYDMLSVETKTLIREVYDEDYALFDSFCTKNS